MKNKSKWISIDDKNNPIPDYERILVYNPQYNCQYIAYMISGVLYEWDYSGDGDGKRITFPVSHWTRLPRNPE